MTVRFQNKTTFGRLNWWKLTLKIRAVIGEFLCSELTYLSRHRRRSIGAKSVARIVSRTQSRPSYSPKHAPPATAVVVYTDSWNANFIRPTTKDAAHISSCAGERTRKTSTSEINTCFLKEKFYVTVTDYEFRGVQYVFVANSHTVGGCQWKFKTSN